MDPITKEYRETVYLYTVFTIIFPYIAFAQILLEMLEFL